MSDFLNIADLEEKRLEDLILEVENLFKKDKELISQISSEISALRKEKLEVQDYQEKNKIESRIEELHKKSSLYLFQNPKSLRNPYFGVLELNDNDLGNLTYKIGKKTIFGKNGKVSVVDWREAPISRLFYEYEKDEEYDEDIRNRERSGIIQTKRNVSISDRELKSISEKGLTISKKSCGTWISNDKKITTSRQKEELKDHSLPEITSLISKDQFQAITLSPEKTFILQGGAGSGKTTVGLHRIAYLTYNEPERFRPSDILLVMYNRALHKYIKGVLPKLGISGGVKTLTYHKFAGSIFSKAQIAPLYGQSNPLAAKIKKSSFIIKLIQRYTIILFEKSFAWVNEKFNLLGFEKGSEIISNASDLGEFMELLRYSIEFYNVENPDIQKIVQKILARLNNHRTDLFKLLTDKNFILNTARMENFSMPESDLHSIINSQKSLQDHGKIDFSDTGILIYLMQLKGINSALPGYSHIMVDEAQDLSPVELATLLMATDEKNSVTICGDMAQKIKSDVFFGNQDGFSGFIKTLAGINRSKIAAETLEIGYRATKEIMDISWHVLGRKSISSVDRSGDPVSIVKTSSMDETLFRAGLLLSEFHEKRPNALTCVICRFKKDADKIYQVLKDNSSIQKIRRHERDDFVFYPGIVVTNVHQVKGLEFTSVMFIDPSKDQFRESDQDRMLLHVAFTRASEKLWVLGHGEMAYGLEGYKTE